MKQKVAVIMTKMDKKKSGSGLKAKVALEARRG
jgi:hypothetical protein